MKPFETNIGIRIIDNPGAIGTVASGYNSIYAYQDRFYHKKGTDVAKMLITTEDIIYISVTINADIDSTAAIIPPKFKIDSIIADGRVSNLSLSSVNGLNDISTLESLNGVEELPLGNTFFSKTNNTSIIFSGVAWNPTTFDIRLKRVIE
jgi:hypothetical protein